MAKKTARVIYSAACILTITLRIAAQDAADDILKIETTLVSVPVIVSDRLGRYVPNLTALDFTLYHDGIKQNIEFFAASEEPLNIALLIDTSRSTTRALGDIKKAALDFIDLLRTQDRAMIVSFDYQTQILTPLTADRAKLRRAVERAEIGERFGTTLREAIDETVNRSFAGIKGRKAVMLLTDGVDVGSDISAADLIYSLEESDTLVYSIFYQLKGGIGRRGRIFGGRGGQRIEKLNEKAEEFLQKLALSTAGRFHRSELPDLSITFKNIVDELRFQYRLGFYPPDDINKNTMHQLNVKTARPDVVVRARASYRIRHNSSDQNVSQPISPHR